MLPDLNRLINYKNDRLYLRYRLDYPNAKMSAEDALTELLKFMWLYHRHKIDKKNTPEPHSLNFSCVIHEEMNDIDNMWHTFLLFTKDYQVFCENYLQGDFFHHEPIDNFEDQNPEHYGRELSSYLSYIYDNLGEQTVITWFQPSD